MMARLANFGYRVPHPNPVSVTYRSNMSLGDLSRKRPINVKVAKLQMFNRLLAAIPEKISKLVTNQHSTRIFETSEHNDIPSPWTMK